MVNVNEQLQFPLKVTYTGAGVLQSSASNLPKNAIFNTTTRNFPGRRIQTRPGITRLHLL